MQKLLQMIGILFILLLVSACQGNTEQEADNNDDYTEENPSDAAEEASEESENESDEDTGTSMEYEEQEVIEEQIDDGEYDIDVETDNQGTRVMFYEIDGEKYYKTIFVKNDHRLKIIDIQQDKQIYNERLQEEEGNTDVSANEDTNEAAPYDYEEQEVIEEQIDDESYEVAVETDNKGTRVMFYEIDGEKYYKTIFVKNDNRLKIIDLQNDDGLIYNETI